MPFWEPKSKPSNPVRMISMCKSQILIEDPQQGLEAEIFESPAVNGVIRLPGNDVRFFSPFLQSPFHPSFALLVRYRSQSYI